MFNKEKVFSSFSVSNLGEAKEFYAKILGLPIEELPMNLLKIDLGSLNHVIIYEKKSHTRPILRYLISLLKTLKMQ